MGPQSLANWDRAIERVRKELHTVMRMELPGRFDLLALADALAEAVEAANGDDCASVMFRDVEHAQVVGSKFDAIVALARAYRAAREGR